MSSVPWSAKGTTAVVADTDALLLLRPTQPVLAARNTLINFADLKIVLGNEFLPLAGGIMSGDIDMNLIHNINNIDKILFK